MTERAQSTVPRTERWGLALGVLAVLICLHQLASFDYWTHLALGRAMWQQGTIRIVEPFVQGASGVAAIPHSWPFQLLLFAVYSLGGHAAISVMVALCGGLTFVLLWTVLPGRTEGWKTALVWTLLAVVAFSSRGRFMPRPESLAYLLCAGGVVLAHRWRRNPCLWPLLAMAVLLGGWYHLHLTWVVGALAMGLPLLLQPRMDFWRSQDRVVQISAVVLVAVGLVYAARVVWPLFGSILAAQSQGSGMGAVSEMQPLWSYPELFWQYAGLAGALGFAAGWSPLGRWRRLVQWLVALGFGVFAARNYVFAYLMMAPPAIEGVLALPPLRLPAMRRLLWGAPLFAALALLAAVFLDRDPPWGAGVRWDLFPQDAARFVREQQLPKPVLNSFDVGGYLNWAWAGDPATFIDGRVFGANPMFASLQTFTNAQAPALVLDRYEIRTVLIRSVFYSSARLFPVVDWLLANPEWILVRASDALVFVRRSEAAGLDRLSPDHAWRYVLWELQVKESEGVDPDHLWYSRAAALLRLGDAPAASIALRRAVEEQPRWAPYYASLLSALRVPLPGG